MVNTSISSAMHDIDQHLFGFLETISWRLLVGLLTAAAIVCLLCQFLSISHPYPIDYGEAPLVDQALRLIRGENIYRPDLSQPPYTISNYPPGFLLALAPWMAGFGPNFWAGRLISSICAWLSAVFCGLIVYRLTGDRLAGWLSGGLFIAIPYVAQWSSFSRIDMLGLVMSLAGMWLLIQQPQRKRHLIGGGVLLVCAIFTRQSFLLAAPLAVFVWIAMEDWKKAMLAAICLGVTILGVGILLQIISGGGFFFNIITANVNEFGWQRLRYWAERIWADLPVLLVFSVISLSAGFWRMKTWRVLAPYLIGGAIGAMTIGKIGSNVNYLLELSAGLSMAGGVVVCWVRSRQPTAILRVAISALIIFQAMLMLQKTLHDYANEIAHRRSQTADLRQLEMLVAGTTGDIPGDEYMGVGLLQDRRIYIQPFEMTQLANAGLWDESSFIAAIRSQTFPMILVHYFPGFAVYKERWTPGMLAAIDSAYVTKEILADTHVYVPRTGETP